MSLREREVLLRIKSRTGGDPIRTTQWEFTGGCKYIPLEQEFVDDR